MPPHSCIHWNDTEKQLVLTRVFELRGAHPEQRLLKLVHQAQEQVLPLVRRRSITNYESMSWLLQGLKDLHAKRNEEAALAADLRLRLNAMEAA